VEQRRDSRTESTFGFTLSSIVRQAEYPIAHSVARERRTGCVSGGCGFDFNRAVRLFQGIAQTRPGRPLYGGRRRCWRSVGVEAVQVPKSVAPFVLHVILKLQLRLIVIGAESILAEFERVGVEGHSQFGASEVFEFEVGFLGDFGHHDGADFLAVVKRPGVVTMGELQLRTALRFDFPADTVEALRTSLAFLLGQLLTRR